MKEIYVEFEKGDTEFLENLNVNFGDDFEIVNKRYLAGGVEVFIAVITILDVTLHCIEFFMTYLANPKNTGRVILTENGKKIIEGYSEEEVINILKEIKDL